jgi:hypothetical protein
MRPYLKSSKHWRSITPDNKIIEHFKQGMFINQISKSDHVCPARIKEVLKKQGLYP